MSEPITNVEAAVRELGALPVPTGSPLRGRALLDALTVERAEAAHNRRLGLEDPHDSPLHHTYRLGRDLPELGGAR